MHTKARAKALYLTVAASALIAPTSALGQANAGDFDGAYVNLQADIEARELEVEAVQQDLETQESEAAAAAQASEDALGALTTDDLAAFADVQAKQQALTSATLAQVASVDAENDALDARNNAQLALADAQGELVDAQTSLQQANNDLAVEENLLNSLLTNPNATAGDIALAQQRVLEARDAVAVAEIAADEAEALVLAASSSVVAADAAYQDAIASRVTATTNQLTAQSQLDDAQTDLDAALAGNTDLQDILDASDPDYVPGGEVASLSRLASLAESELADVLVAQEELAGEQAVLASLNRQDSLLTEALNSGQENIALASGALTGDPTADGSNFETEVLGALTDHEGRITSNADSIAVLEVDLAEEAALRIAGDAATLAAANVYTDEAVEAEAALRIAGDAATLAAANVYTDEAVEAEAALRIAGDAATLAAANVYTDEAVEAEAALRIAGDAATLAAANVYTDTSIAAEATARVAADTALSTRITNETNARIAADNALGQRITDETNARIAADNVLRDQIASSTATAIALGGTTILPDTNFTLSGNVGFYEGAQAMAVNAAAKVGENVYVTGAVGGGLNKQGNIGGRVGFVIGF